MWYDNYAQSQKKYESTSLDWSSINKKAFRSLFFSQSAVSRCNRQKDNRAVLFLTLDDCRNTCSVWCAALEIVLRCKGLNLIQPCWVIKPNACNTLF